MRRTLAGRHAVSLLVGLMVFAGGCAANPVTGRRELYLISEGQEIQMGREASENDRQRVGEVANVPLRALVQRIGAGIAAKSERPSLPWGFHVLDDAAVNAFAYPGGFIFITRGLATHLNSEAELAEVIGHEIGHVTAKHTVTALSQQQMAQIGLLGGSIVSPTIARYGNLLGTGASLLFLKFGRDDELQADALGFRYALAEGYDVRESPKLFTMLERLRGGDGRVPAWQSTHPDPGNRVARARERLAKTPASVLAGTRVGRDRYLAVLDGMVFGDDPRLGYFTETTFVHPQLRFVFDVPRGWKRANLPDAVIAASPDGAAQLQLVPGRGTPEQAMQGLLQQQGVTVRTVRSTTMNGLPAVMASFAAQTSQGALSGVAVALTHGSATFLLVGMTVPDGANRYAPLLEQAVRSFRPLTDPAASAIQPPRLRIVTLDRAMTGEAFLRRYPSVVPGDLIYTINGIEASTALPAGLTLKQVVATDGR